MPLADYAKFYEMLLNNGVGPATGERVLSPLGAKNAFFGAVLNVKNDLLPRQARDKHRKR